jgi:hypothetical protein
MSDYTPITDFSVKDGLTANDPEKIIAGADVDAEFTAIQTAILSKFDSNEIATEAEAEAETLDTKIITPLQLKNVLQDNAGVAYDLKELTVAGFSAADAIFGWDDGAAAAIGFTLGDGLATNGTAIEVDEGNGLIFSTGVLAVGAGAGITVNTNDVQITDVVAGAAQPVAVTSGTFTFDLSSITTITGSSLAYSTDGFVISDNGTIKVMNLDDFGLKVKASQTTQSLVQNDLNSILTGTTAATFTIQDDADVAHEDGSFFVFVNTHATNQHTIAGDTAVSIVSTFTPGGSTAGSVVVTPGGTAVAFKLAANTWAISGDLESGS